MTPTFSFPFSDIAVTFNPQPWKRPGHPGPAHGGAVRRAPIQFLAPSRRRQADAQQMTIEVERVVLNPHRVIQIELAVG